MRELTIYKNEEFLKKLKQFQKQAEKIGVDFSVRLIETGYDDDGFEYFTYEIPDWTPTFDGWSIVAKIETDDQNNTYIPFSNEKVKKEWMEHRCDHCNKNHVKSSHYVIKNETGTYLSLGSGCIKHYIKNPAAATLADKYRLLIEKDEKDGCMPACSVRVLLYVAEDIIRQDGYTKTNETDCTGRTVISTKEKALYIMDKERKNIKVPAKYMEKFEEFKNSIDPKGNAFLMNVQTILDAKFIPANMVGVACYIPVMLEKFNQSKQPKKEQKTSNWVAKPKDKIEIEVTYKNHFGFDTQWGYMLVYILEDKDGNQFKVTGTVTEDIREYISRVEQAKDFTEQEIFSPVMKIKGTVKAHTEWNNIKQTEITRGKILNMISNDDLVDVIREYKASLKEEQDRTNHYKGV